MQILSYFFLVGLLWWIVDAFLINGMIASRREALRWRLTQDALAADRAGAPASA